MIWIIAPTRNEAAYYARQMDIHSRRWIYYHDWTQLSGTRNPNVIKVGRWREAIPPDKLAQLELYQSIRTRTQLN